MNELESAKAYVEHSDKLTDRGRKHMQWLIKQVEIQQKEIERCENYLNELGFTRLDWEDEN